MIEGKLLAQYSCTGRSVCFTSPADEYRECIYSVSVYQNYVTRLGELIIFEPWARKLSFLPNELDIFDIRQHFVCSVRPNSNIELVYFNS